MCEGKLTRPIEDAMFLRKEIVDALKRSDEKMENYSKKTDEKMDIFLQTIKDSVGTQLHGMNSTIAKMKEEDDDRYKQINERIMNMERKILDIDEKCETEATNPREPMKTRTSESEVQQLLKETTTEIGMSIENART